MYKTHATFWAIQEILDIEHHKECPNVKACDFSRCDFEAGLASSPLSGGNFWRPYSGAFGYINAQMLVRNIEGVELPTCEKCCMLIDEALTIRNK